MFLYPKTYAYCSLIDGQNIHRIVKKCTENCFMICYHRVATLLRICINIGERGKLYLNNKPNDSIIKYLSRQDIKVQTVEKQNT